MIDYANIFSFKALPTENIPFDETTLNVLIRDLPKSYPFDVVLFDGTKQTITKELDLYDFLLVDYYDIFNDELEKYKQKLIDDARILAESIEQARIEKELQNKHDQATIKAMQDLDESRKAFVEKYGDSDEAGRLEIDKQVYIEKAIERNEIKKHNDRVKRQLNNKFGVSLSQYDSKYLDCEISLFDKLRTDATMYLQNGVTTIFFASYYNANDFGIMSIEELAKKIIQKADKRDAYIATLIATMKEDLKIHIKE